MPENMESYLHMDLDTFREQAVFSDETKQFRSPMEPLHTEQVEVTVRVGKGTFTAVFLCTQEREYLMEEREQDGLFSYYKVLLPPTEKKIRYHFRLQYGEQYGYYTKFGYFHQYQDDGWFEILRDYQTPDWAKGAVMYQILPDRFCNGDSANDVKTNEYTYLARMVERVEDWDRLPEEGDFCRFYGGDLQGILDKLDYLKDLGVEVLYLNPIFVSPSNHKYDVQDYDHIDPHLGKIVTDTGTVLEEGQWNASASLYQTRTTDAENLAASDALFAKLAEEAHQRGIRVLLDGVFNHCGAFHKWLDREGIYRNQEKGAYLHPDSPYRNYFYWKMDGNYEGWWDYQNHPKLNIEGCPSLKEEILSIGKKWLSPPYQADGWRLDVAADLGKTAAFNHHFWAEFRSAVKGISKDKFLLAEHYGDASSWLEGDQWDSVMNYDAFMEPVTWFLTGVSKHSTERRDDLYNNADAFWGAMEYHMGRLPVQALFTAMNELSNHDHSRFLTRTNGKTGRLYSEGSQAAGEGIDLAVMREAVLLQMTWIGSPTVYYGDEAGVVGWTDPDNRRTYPWGKENHDLILFHKKAISLRKKYKVLRHGSLKQLYGTYGVLAYGRFDENDRILVALNNTEEQVQVQIPLWQIGVNTEGDMENLLTTGREGFMDAPVHYPVKSGQIELLLPPKSGMVLKEVSHGL